MMLFCTTTCIACVIRIGNSRRRRTASSSSSDGRPLDQLRRQQIGGRDRVLNREIDADAADRRHRMRGVADAEQPRARPRGSRLIATVSSLTSSQFLTSASPGLRIGAIRRCRRASAEPPRLHRVVLSLGYYIGALPIVAAIERHHHLAGIDAPEQVFGFARELAGTKPQHVHRRADLVDREVSPFAAPSNAGRRIRWSDPPGFRPAPPASSTFTPPPRHLTG